MENTESIEETVYVDSATDFEEEIPVQKKYPGLKPWPKGVSGNPGGRPKDTFRDYLSRKFREMSDEEKEAWLKEQKVSGEYMVRHAEGNPTENRNIKVSVPTPILGGASAAITLENTAKEAIEARSTTYTGSTETLTDGITNE